ncbi:MAG: hypothetical protein AB7S74_15595 [Hyphomicrobium sp.]
MTTIKTLYLNREFIADYESTGDDLKDMELTRSILRDKGLYKEIDRDRAIFNHAHAFATTSSYLYNRDLQSVPRNGVSLVPFIVNSAFAIELYLKTIGQLHKISLRGHDLIELFDGLPAVAHADIEKHFAKCNWQCGIATLADYRKALEQLRGAFVEWRYLYEKQNANIISFGPLIFTMEVLHETCTSLLNSSTRGTGCS